MANKEVNQINNNPENRHKVFKNDPKYFKSLLNKTVEIVTVDGKIHKGKVYVVDPVSESIVTITNSEDRCNVNIYVGHAIKSFKICNHNEQINTDSTNKQYKEDTEELKLKRLNIKSWLIKNLVDVQEDGLTLKVGDGEYLFIEPPYDNEHCYCSNTIILQRLREILNKMPNSNT